MNDYIEREAALDICQKEYEDRLGMADYCGDTVAYNIAGAIKKIPAADVVEAVRCKDCQFWQDNNGGHPHPECRWGKDETPDADDYCSFGERREDNA